MFKSFIKSVKIYSTIVSLLAFTPLWASPTLEPTDENKRIRQAFLDLRDDMAIIKFDFYWYDSKIEILF